MQKEIKIEVSSNRNVIEGVYVGDFFWENNNENDYCYDCDIDVYEKNKKVAYLSLTLFDEIKILDDSKDIVDIADSISGDLNLAIQMYINSKLNKEEREDSIFATDHLCYIDTCYIYPEFRHKGVATYLLKNLPQILKYSINVSIRASIISPAPQYPKTENLWVDLIEGKEQMLSLMIKFIKKMGYKSIGRSIFAKNHIVKEFR